MIQMQNEMLRDNIQRSGNVTSQNLCVYPSILLGDSNYYLMIVLIVVYYNRDQRLSRLSRLSRLKKKKVTLVPQSGKKCSLKVIKVLRRQKSSRLKSKNGFPNVNVDYVILGFLVWVKLRHSSLNIFVPLYTHDFMLDDGEFHLFSSTLCFMQLIHSLAGLEKTHTNFLFEFQSMLNFHYTRAYLIQIHKSQNLEPRFG